MKFLRSKLFLFAVMLVCLLGAFAACGKDKTVTLTFHANGGTEIASVKAVPGDVISLETPTREQYAFDGWYETEDFSGPSYTDSLTVPEKSTAYYAKWTEAKKLTLDLDGGSSAPAYLWVKPGAKLLQALADITPVKGGLTFGAWFADGVQVSASAVMPNEDYTVKAAYLVSYTVEVYLQNASGSSYLRSEENLTEGRWFAGQTYTPDDIAIDHFTRTDSPANETPVTTLTLSENGGNVFKFYYDRDRYTVIYRANAPVQGSSGSVAPQEGAYGTSLKLAANAFVCEGYRFAGWSTSETGDVEYTAGQTISLNSSLLLYAVWDRGYTDRYGSPDLIFFPRLETNKAILLRGGVEFTGARTDNSFSFTTSGGTMFAGKVYGTQYSYQRNDLKGTYVFYANTIDPAVTEQYDPTQTLVIDEYLNVTYTKGGNAVTGHASYDEERGDYLFTGDDGKTAFHFLVSSGDQYDYDAVFSIGRDDFGFYVDFTMLDFESGMGYTTYTMLLALNGYRTATLMDAQNMMQYDGSYYIVNEYEFGVEGYTFTIYKVMLYIYDSYGLLTGGEPGYVTNYVYTVPEVDEMYDGYVSADRYYGDYEGEGGASLSLDGFGIFPDSAVYTDAEGKTVKGNYTVESDLLDGVKVTVTSQDLAGPVSFTIDTAALTLGEYVEQVHGDYVEYRLMDGSALKPPFILLYAEEKGEKKAEVYMPNEEGNDLICVAKGTYEQELIGNDSRFGFYVFHRTWTLEGHEEDIAARLRFYTTEVTSTQTLESYHVYCVLERDDTVYWEKVTLEDGAYILNTSTVSTGGLGALYFAADGNIYEGEFTKSGSEYGFEANYGTLVYADSDGNIATLYYELTTDEDGGLHAAEIAFTERMLYIIPEEGTSSASVGSRMLFIDSKGNASYTDDNGDSDRKGTYAENEEKSVFGDTVYTLTVGGSVLFEYVVYTLPEYGDETPLAALYIGTTAGTYTASDGATLQLDGFYRARLTDADGRASNGTYTKSGKQLTYLSEEGTEQIFVLEGTTFKPIDWASSQTWPLLDNNYEPIHGYVIDFDGEGGVKVTGEDGKTVVSTGSYLALGTVYAQWGLPEYLLRDVNFGSGYPQGSYRVTFAINNVGAGACLVQNTAALGTFIDGDWNILTLDGYAHGSIATNEFTAIGEYQVVGKAQNFLAFTVDEEAQAAQAGAVYYVVVDAEAGTFFMNDYSALASVYLAPDFDSIVFGADGTAYIGASSGPYFVRDGKAYVYLSSRATVIDAPGSESYTYGGKTYSLWDGKELALHGKIEFLDKNGDPYADMGATDAVMTFTPNRMTNANVAVKFTVDGKQYDGFKLNIYEEEALAPTVTYARNAYPIAFTYTKDAAQAFTVTAGYNSVRLLDHNARFINGDETDKDKNPIYRGGYIEKSTVGFGPLPVGSQDVVYSGGFYYLTGETDHKLISFDGIPEEDVLCVGYVPSYGNRMEIVFEFEGETYAINYYEYYQGGNYYWAYGFYTVKTFETDLYTVRVKYLAYTHFSTAPGYVNFSDKTITNHAIGQPIAATLIEKASGEAVVAYDTGYLAEGYGTGVWIVDKEGVIEEGSTGTCTWGKGYLITFTRDGENSITGVTVKEYQFVQVVNYMECLVNLFIDEDGKVMLAGFAVYNADFGRYDWLTDPHDFASTAENTWTFKGTWNKKESTYTLTATAAEDNEAGYAVYEVTMSAV